MGQPSKLALPNVLEGALVQISCDLRPELVVWSSRIAIFGPSWRTTFGPHVVRPIGSVCVSVLRCDEDTDSASCDIYVEDSLIRSCTVESSAGEGVHESQSFSQSHA